MAKNKYTGINIQLQIARHQRLSAPHPFCFPGLLITRTGVSQEALRKTRKKIGTGNKENLNTYLTDMCHPNINILDKIICMSLVHSNGKQVQFHAHICMLKTPSHRQSWGTEWSTQPHASGCLARKKCPSASPSGRVTFIKLRAWLCEHLPGLCAKI